MINTQQLDDGGGDIIELQPLARSGRDSPGETESGAVGDDDSSPPPLYSTSTSAIPKILLFRVLPLVLFTAFVGTYILRAYENEDVLEDIEYKGQQETQHAPASSANTHNNRLSRWQQIGTDCPAGQQLANTTDLHCGILLRNGKLIEPLIPNENNITCGGGVTMEPNHCLMPSRGEWIWEQSNEPLPPLPRRFGNHHNHNSSDSLSLPRCNTQDDILNGSTVGEEFDREWVPANSCSVVPLNPFTWTDNSKCQVTIAMMGDSHIRNLFTATVHGLRADNAFVEAHEDISEKDSGIILTYEWRKNVGGSASDRFVVQRNTNANNNDNNHTSLFFDDCPCNKNITRCLRIVFIWSPRFADQVTKMQLLNDLQTDLAIVEPGNSYEVSTVLSQEWTTAIDNLLQHNDNRHLAVLHFPYGRQPKRRKEAIEAWISSNNNTTTHDVHNKMSYWQQGNLQFSGKQSKKTWHYACGLGRSQVRNDVVMAIEPCTDESDTAYIRAITTMHFDAFGAKSAH